MRSFSLVAEVLWGSIFMVLIMQMANAEQAKIGLLIAENSAEHTYLKMAIKIMNDTGDHNTYMFNADDITDSLAREPKGKTCEMLKRGLVSMIIPTEPLYAAQIASYGHSFKVPLISFNTVDTSTDTRHHNANQAFILRLLPDRRITGKAISEIVTYFNWRSFTVLYEDKDDLFYLTDLLLLSSRRYGRAPDIDVIKVLKPPNKNHQNYQKFIKDNLLKNTRSGNRVVVHIDVHRIKQFLSDAVAMQAATSRFSYIFTTWDLHTLNLEKDVPGLKCNVTGLKLINQSSIDYEYKYTPRWSDTAQSLMIESPQSPQLPINIEAGMTTLAAVVLDTLKLLRAITAAATDCSGGSCNVKSSYAPLQMKCDANMSWANGMNWQRLYRKISHQVAKETQTAIYNIFQQRIATENKTGTIFKHPPRVFHGFQPNFAGVTGSVRLNQQGQRVNVTLTVIHYEQQPTGAYKRKNLGYWTDERGFQDLDPTEVEDADDLANKTLRVVVHMEEPFVMEKKDKDSYTGNDRYEGYCIDLLNEIQKLCKFSYEIHKVADSAYGSMNEEGEWNGMVGELVRNDADLAAASLTISSSRSEVIDFTVPFMHLGISILFKKPANEESKLFAFLQPLSLGVWIYLLLSYLTVSLMMWLLARFTPYEWYNPHPHTKFDTADSQFTLLNSLWFTVGSLMQQGSDVAPRAFSTRLVAAVWWFFTVVLISSYTAKLAAFLTVARMSTDIENADDLAKQEKVKYGSLESGSTMNFFMESRIPVYERMWQFMQASGPSVFVNTSKEGIARVKAGGYAYLMESAMLEYNAERDCELMQIGGLIDSKGYGIALRKGSPFLQPISQAILKLQEYTVLEVLKDKWWSRERGGGKCKVFKILSSQPSARKLKNIGGIFFILFGGLMLAFIVATFEFLYKLRNDPALAKLSLCAALFRELNVTAKCLESQPNTPRRRIRRVSTLMALPLYPPYTGDGTADVDGTALIDETSQNKINQQPHQQHRLQQHDDGIGTLTSRSLLSYDDMTTTAQQQQQQHNIQQQPYNNNSKLLPLESADTSSLTNTSQRRALCEQGSEDDTLCYIDANHSVVRAPDMVSPDTALL